MLWHDNCNVENKLHLNHMGRLYSLLFTFFIFLSVTSNTIAQSVSKNNFKGFYVGGSIGTAWQDSDIVDNFDLGWGFNGEWYITKSSESLLGFALRFSFLHSRTSGQNELASTNFDLNTNVNGTDGNPNYLGQSVYYNYQTEAYDFSGHLLIHANKLRHQTGLILYGFAGVGATYYDTHSDLLDFNDNNYNYSVIPQGTTPEIIQDGTFETRTSVDYAVFAPTVGFGVGYQVRPFLTIGMEYRRIFTATDLLDGSLFDANGPTNNNDKYNYLSLKAGLRIFGNNNSSVNGAPDIKLTYPTSRVTRTYNCKADINVKIKNIESVEFVMVEMNGELLDNSFYNFREQNGRLTLSTELQSDTTVFNIFASNSFGSDSLKLTYICNFAEQQIQKYGPKVYLKRPSKSHYTSYKCKETVQFNLKNIRTVDNIELIQDGDTLAKHLYTFDNYFNTVTYNAQFTDTTVITCYASNNYGKIRKSVELYCNTNPPEVELTSHRTRLVNDYIVNAEFDLKNVGPDDKVTIYENGIAMKNNFHLYSDLSRITVNKTHIQDGNYKYVAEVISNRGNAADSITYVADIPRPPTVNFVSNQRTFHDCFQSFSLQTTNIDSIEQVDIEINGFAFNRFDLDASGEISFNHLIFNNSNIVVTVVNDDGSDKASLSVSCGITTPSGPVTLPNPTNNGGHNGGNNGGSNGGNNGGSNGGNTGGNNGGNTGGNNGGNSGGTTTGGSTGGTTTGNTTGSNNGPKITIKSPTSLSNTVNCPSNETIVAYLDGVLSKDKISISINGNTLSNNEFAYFLASGKVTFTTNITDNTSIVIEATNTTGTSTKVINYTCSCPVGTYPPTISNINTIVDSTNCMVKVNAKLTNINSKNEISVYQDNTELADSDFTYNALTGKLEISTTTNGTSTITIYISNNDGNDRKDINVTCNIPSCPNLKIDKTSVNRCQASIEASFSNIKYPQNIEILQNNQLMNSADYSIDIANNSIKINKTIDNEANTFTIRYVENNSIYEQSTNLTCEQIDAPKIISSKSNSDQSCKTNIELKLENCISKNEISLSINGQKISKDEFTFNVSQQEISLSTNIQNDSIKLNVTAKNELHALDTNLVFYCSVIEKPTITFDKLINDNCVLNAELNISNTLKSEISVSLNGEKINFDFEDDILSLVDLPLVNGENPLEVIATNVAGTTTINKTLTCQKTVDFEITNGTVIPKENFKAQVDILGCALQSNGQDLDVQVRVEINNQDQDAFGNYATRADENNVNDGQTHSWQSDSIGPNATITISAKSFLTSTGNSPTYEYHSNQNSDMVMVLKNGDDAPDLEGFENQSSAETYLRPYIENGKIKLDENQVIYLFELGTNRTHVSWYDLQDCVVLVTLLPTN